MIEGLEAAQHAAHDYQARNEGEELHVKVIRGLLDDAVTRASRLDDYANEHARAQATEKANAAAAAAAADLAAAQTATAGSLLPDTVLAPDDKTA